MKYYNNIFTRVYLGLRRRFNIWYSYYFDKYYRAAYPCYIYININNICNLKCRMCDIGQKVETTVFYKNLIPESKDLLDFEDWRYFIDDVRKFKPFIFINGTEPLLYNELNKFLKYADKNKIVCNITTNGTLLEKWAEDLVKNNVAKLFVSVDGPPQVHDRIRGVKGTFDKIYIGIQKVIEIKERLNKKEPKIIIACTIMEDNYKCLEELKVYFNGLDIEYFQYDHLDFKTKPMVEIHNQKFKIYPATETCISGIDITNIDANILWRNIKDMKKKYRNVKFPYNLSRKEIKKFYSSPEQFLRYKCTMPWFSSQICADGTVIPLDRCLNIKLGNIKEKRFTEIWNDEPYRKFRKILKENRSFPICARCAGVIL